MIEDPQLCSTCKRAVISDDEEDDDPFCIDDDPSRIGMEDELGECLENEFNKCPKEEKKPPVKRRYVKSDDDE